jgi:hypothetical protein
MKTFKDLRFRPHAALKDAVHARLKFDNGTYISVVGGHKSLYGNGRTSFEVKSTITDRKNTVSGWLSVSQITSRMKYLQGLRCQCLTDKK